MNATQLAINEGRSVFQHSVKNVSDMKGSESVIKPSRNVKLGKRVSASMWNGFPIYTVTFEERATCPSTCGHWATCYGNNMMYATRYRVGPDLEATMERELEALQKKHPKGFLVRLHILGDFYSLSYVHKWMEWMQKFPACHVYGYTARLPGTGIGDALLTVGEAFPDRWKVRVSGDHTRTMSALSVDTQEAKDMLASKQAFQCPEQTGKVKDCASCGLCWASSKPVTFITH